MRTDFHFIQTRLRERALPPLPAPIEPQRIKQAAVALILREHQAQTELLIIKRAEHPNDPWSGHLALPGGRAELNDANLIETAARETREEVGLELQLPDAIIGCLNPLAPISPSLPKLEIAPVIALAPPDANLTLNAEVAAAFWLPVDALLSAGLSDVYRYALPNRTIKYPAYPSPHGPIWGITQRILTDFLAMLQSESNDLES